MGAGGETKASSECFYAILKRFKIVDNGSKAWVDSFIGFNIRISLMERADWVGERQVSERVQIEQSKVRGGAEVVQWEVEVGGEDGGEGEKGREGGEANKGYFRRGHQPTAEQQLLWKHERYMIGGLAITIAINYLIFA